MKTKERIERLLIDIKESEEREEKRFREGLEESSTSNFPLMTSRNLVSRYEARIEELRTWKAALEFVLTD